MKTTLLLLSAFLVSLVSTAQWTQRTSFPGTARSKATSFSMNNKIYVMGGITNNAVVLNEFWEYDIATDTWTQKPAFPGPERYGAVSFVISNTGYIATGANDNGYLDDLWAYNPTTGTWSQRTGLPAGSAQHENQRREAFGFAIGSLGYLGGGDGFVFGANSTTNFAFYDLWEYNPSTNSWTQKSDMPGFLGRNLAIGVSSGGKGYVGLGCDVWQSTNRTDFLEYDPVTDTWTTKASFLSNFSSDCSAFALDSDIYVVGGIEITTISASSQVVKYNIPSDTWTSLPAFNGGAIVGEVSGTTTGSAFAGTGYNSSIFARSDWWEFSLPAATHDISSKSGMDVYPNPATKDLHVVVPENSHAQLFSSDGRLIAGMELTAKRQNIMDVESLPAGIYFLKITNDRFSESRKISITK